MANDRPKQEVLEDAKGMYNGAREQLQHPTLKCLPRFKEGIKNSKEIYSKLINILED